MSIYQSWFNNATMLSIQKSPWQLLVDCSWLRMTAALRNFDSKPATTYLMAQRSLETDCSQDFYKKSNKSAVVIIPPNDLWEQIQNIRKIHDRAYKRWMPHINLLYPFLEDDGNGRCFTSAAEKLVTGLTAVKQFKVTFDKNSFRSFHHKKNSTLWLMPQVDTTTDSSNDGKQDLTDYSGVHADILRLQHRLEELFPQCEDLRTISGSFTPHLSLGQFKPSETEKCVEEFRSNWQSVTFVVNEIHLISRKSFEAPFEIQRSVPLCQSA